MKKLASLTKTDLTGPARLKEALGKIPLVLSALATRRLTIECDSLPHRFRRVPVKKLLNWILLETSLRFKPEIPWGWPTHLMVEPTNRCNLRCLLCPVSAGLKRPTGDLSPDLFEKVMAEVGEYVFLLLLWDWGEPLLHPASPDLIRAARARGIKVVTASNGHPLAYEHTARRLVASGLDTLIIALDGITQETYSRYRHGGDLETVLRGVRNVVAQKRTQQSATPLVNLCFLVMRHNEGEIPRLRELARDLGVDVLTLKKLHFHRHDGDIESQAVTQKSYRDLIPRDRRYRRFLYDEAGEPRRRVHNPCKHLWNNPVIHWNGVVSPCSFDHDELQVVGDLRTKTLKNIWRGPAYRRLRRQFRRDWQNLPLCRGCSYAYEGGDCSREHIAATIFLK